MIDIKNMDRKKLITISIIVGSIIIYLISIIIRLSYFSASVKERDITITKLQSEVKKEVKAKKLIENLDEKALKNSYFYKHEKYFEGYIREIFGKYKIKLSIYQSKISKKNYSEIDINFRVNAFQFFRLLYEIENGKKVIVIRKMSINTDGVPYFKISMKLGGYYK